LKIASEALEQSKTQYNEQLEYFSETGSITLSGLIVSDADKDKINKSDKLTAMYRSLVELSSAIRGFEISYEVAKGAVENYEGVYNKAQADATRLIEEKKQLNQEFFKKFARYIQEGTWKDEAHLNDDLYFIDARAALNNSCFPQVSYQFDVIDVSVLPGMEGFEFHKGDKTFVEDPEFFGEVDGVPYREEVIISETVRMLDEPDKNSVVVRNYKNQF
jgi:hypothetical protein